MLTGRAGQLGSELEPRLAALCELHAFDRGVLDLTDRERIRRAVRELSPQVIVNAAAYTAVDAAEQHADECSRVNHHAVTVLAEEAARLDALLVHFSTDYVFDGEKRMPYRESDPTGPLNAYGRSKLAGERAIAASGCRHLVLRTSWVYGRRGKSFPLRIRQLAAEGRALRVVDDQVGCPTSAADLAAAVARIFKQGLQVGLYHACGGGETTWHGFARAIVGPTVPVEAVSTSQYGGAARRPAYAVLSNDLFRDVFGFRLPHWEESFSTFRRAQAW